MKRVLPLLLLLTACQPEEPAAEIPVLEPPPAGDGVQFAMTGVTVGPYEESWMCSVYPIPADETLNVNWTHHLQNEGMHHMTLSAPGLGRSGIPYGTVPCEDLYADTELMAETAIIYGSQGTADAEMHLPDGVVAALPPTLDIIHEMHYVNPTDKPVELYSYINAYTIPESQVVDAIWGGSVRDEYIVIPPVSSHTEWSRCVFNRDVEVIFLSSHTHGLGVEFTIAPFDGVETGPVIYTNTDWHDPAIVQYDPPLVVPQGQGFEWTCTWENDSEDEIHYGLNSTDEMCNLAVVHTPFDISAHCEVVETSDGVLWSP